MISAAPVLPKAYEPASSEKKWYDHWLARGHFHARPNQSKTPYTVLIPPPNVTGSLTVGHVLNNTVQDILVRRARMMGREACWVPGTDHASIATEVKVMASLESRGIRKEDLSREEFLAHAWEWKREYGSLIIEQLKRLGCSCDWSRERFTMEEGYYRAVITAFVRLFEKGWIYRGKRLVNWDPATRSAISNEEVTHREVRGHLWHIRYPLEGGDGHLVVATTRPETMLGDTAVAVHPEDPRYRHLLGRFAVLPFAERRLPVIADASIDPAFGTGCLKVTPAHDMNDFLMGQRHRLETINILNEDATLNDAVPAEFRGLDRFEARRRIVERLRGEGLLEKVEDYTTSIGYSDRGGVPIEPFLSEQWFMKMSELAKPALEAVRDGGIRFHPEHWAKIYEHWMENIQDWCISRQLWWGHRIPVWTHRDTGEVYCAVAPPERPEEWEQDPDVLDTWASSWIWPIGVHGWPEVTDDLRYFHPSDTLVTAGDIIFFWVARMIMSSLEFRGEVPFRDVYFTGIVRDLQGRKMSKSLGNSPDPIALMDRYGADAVRFGLLLIAPQGHDILFSEERLETGRNFMNKLWNAARFVLMNAGEEAAPDPQSLRPSEVATEDRWILSRLSSTIEEINRNFDAFRFNDAAKQVYEFTWSDFCDWYIEAVKSRLYGRGGYDPRAARAVSLHVLKTVLKLLHPFAPFVTEEIWQRMREAGHLPADSPDLIIAPWPQPAPDSRNADLERQFDFLQRVVTGVRTVRSVMNVSPARKFDLFIRSADGEFLKSHDKIICDLARVDRLEIGQGVVRPAQSATVVVDSAELFIPLAELIDVGKERQRLQGEIESLMDRIRQAEAKLGNDKFRSRAPAEVVAREKAKLELMGQQLYKLRQNQEMLT